MHKILFALFEYKPLMSQLCPLNSESKPALGYLIKKSFNLSEAEALNSLS